MTKQPVHLAACRYSGELLTPRSQMEDDCCCPPPDTPVIRCKRVTGSSSWPMDWEARRGPQRPDGRYEVLCGYPASFLVQPYTFADPEQPSCGRCLDYTVRQVSDQQVLITKIPREPDVPAPPPGEIVRRLKEKKR